MRLNAILTSALLLLLSFAASAQCIVVRDLSEDSLPYKPGEKLNYTLHYKWGIINADVGEFRMSIDTAVFNGRKVFHSRAGGQSVKIVERFFKLRENFDSWFTREGLRPLKFIRDTQEGRYWADDTYLYDWDNRCIDASLNNKRRGARSVKITLDDCTYDVSSILYFARCMDVSSLRAGGRYPLSFAIDDDRYRIFLTFLGRETIEVPGTGRVRTLKFSCNMVEGEVFSGKEDALLWISDDANRIPVYVEAEVVRGRVEGRLSSWSGLKHDFSSREVNK